MLVSGINRHGLGLACVNETKGFVEAGDPAVGAQYLLVKAGGISCWQCSHHLFADTLAVKPGMHQQVLKWLYELRSACAILVRLSAGRRRRTPVNEPQRVGPKRKPLLCMQSAMRSFCLSSAILFSPT